MIEIGLRWHQGLLSVSWEHYAIGVIDKILIQLAAKLEPELQNAVLEMLISLIE